MKDWDIFYKFFKGFLFHHLTEGVDFNEILEALRHITRFQRKRNIDSNKYKTVTFTEGQLVFNLKNLLVMYGDDRYNQKMVEKDMKMICAMIEQFNLGEIMTDINYSNRKLRRWNIKKNKNNKKI